MMTPNSEHEKSIANSTENPCKICHETVALNSGLHCYGPRKHYIHFKCLNFSETHIEFDEHIGHPIISPCLDCYVESECATQHEKFPIKPNISRVCTEINCLLSTVHVISKYDCIDKDKKKIPLDNISEIVHDVKNSMLPDIYRNAYNQTSEVIAASICVGSNCKLLTSELHSESSNDLIIRNKDISDKSVASQMESTTSLEKRMLEETTYKDYQIMASIHSANTLSSLLQSYKNNNPNETFNTTSLETENDYVRTKKYMILPGNRKLRANRLNKALIQPAAYCQTKPIQTKDCEILVKSDPSTLQSQNSSSLSKGSNEIDDTIDDLNQLYTPPMHLNRYQSAVNQTSKLMTVSAAIGSKYPLSETGINSIIGDEISRDNHVKGHSVVNNFHSSYQFFIKETFRPTYFLGTAKTKSKLLPSSNQDFYIDNGKQATDGRVKKSTFTGADVGQVKQRSWYDDNKRPQVTDTCCSGGNCDSMNFCTSHDDLHASGFSAWDAQQKGSLWSPGKKFGKKGSGPKNRCSHFKNVGKSKRDIERPGTKSSGAFGLPRAKDKDQRGKKCKKKCSSCGCVKKKKKKKTDKRKAIKGTVNIKEDTRSKEGDTESDSGSVNKKRKKKSKQHRGDEGSSDSSTSVGKKKGKKRSGKESSESSCTSTEEVSKKKGKKKKSKDGNVGGKKGKKQGKKKGGTESSESSSEENKSKRKKKAKTSKKSTGKVKGKSKKEDGSSAESNSSFESVDTKSRRIIIRSDPPIGAGRSKCGVEKCRDVKKFSLRKDFKDEIDCPTPYLGRKRTKRQSDDEDNESLTKSGSDDEADDKTSLNKKSACPPGCNGTTTDGSSKPCPDLCPGGGIWGPTADLPRGQKHYATHLFAAQARSTKGLLIQSPNAPLKNSKFRLPILSKKSSKESPLMLLKIHGGHQERISEASKTRSSREQSNALWLLEGPSKELPEKQTESPRENSSKCPEKETVEESPKTQMKELHTNSTEMVVERSSKRRLKTGETLEKSSKGLIESYLKDPLNRPEKESHKTIKEQVGEPLQKQVEKPTGTSLKHSFKDVIELFLGASARPKGGSLKTTQGLLERGLSEEPKKGSVKKSSKESPKRAENTLEDRRPHKSSLKEEAPVGIMEGVHRTSVKLFLRGLGRSRGGSRKHISKTEILQGSLDEVSDNKKRKLPLNQRKDLIEDKIEGVLKNSITGSHENNIKRAVLESLEKTAEGSHRNPSKESVLVPVEKPRHELVESPLERPEMSKDAGVNSSRFSDERRQRRSREHSSKDQLVDAKSFSSDELLKWAPLTVLCTGKSDCFCKTMWPHSEGESSVPGAFPIKSSPPDGSPTYVPIRRTRKSDEKIQTSTTPEPRINFVSKSCCTFDVIRNEGFDMMSKTVNDVNRKRIMMAIEHICQTMGQFSTDLENIVSKIGGTLS